MELHEAAPPPAEVKHLLETPFGALHAWTSGSPRPGRPALLTFPDVGHTHLTCFSELFGHPEMAEISRSFHLVHLEAPGMEEGAPPYPPGYQYPSLEQLAEALPGVLQGLGIRSIVGVGVGAGAFVLARFGLLHPEAVEGLVLLNLDPKAKGWMDWAASKLSGLTMSTNEMILSHLWTQDELAAAPPPVRRVQEHLAATPNPALLWSMYTSRADLGLERSGAKSLRCPTLLVVGDHAPHEDAVVECNAKLDPTQTSFLKMADGGGQPQIAQPGRLTEAIKYFLQGMGYMAASAMTRLSRSRTGSGSVSAGEAERGRSRTLSRGSTGTAATPASP